MGLTLDFLDPSVAVAQSEQWLAQARREISEREYVVSESEKGLQAPNRAHNLRTYFDSTGIRVYDRTAPSRPELVRLQLTRMGRGSALETQSNGSIQATGTRVEIVRPGLVEWYENTNRGLEQGFVIHEKPTGSGRVVLELALAGAHASLAGDDVVLSSNGRRLRYGALRAWDERGRVLDARMRLAPKDALRIVVDDDGAAYPITIDPSLTDLSGAELISDQAIARLGWSVASAGDVNGDGFGDVVIGTPFFDVAHVDDGAVFIYLGSTSGIASGGITIAATRLDGNIELGSVGASVAGAGDVNGDGFADVIVGASSYSAGESQEGAAFVFLGSASGIPSGLVSTGARLETNQAGDLLGSAVATAGDVNGDGYADIVVGAPGCESTSTTPSEGCAFVFLGGPVGISAGAAFHRRLESNLTNARFGSSVASAGDVNGDGFADVVVGAENYSNPETSEGASFQFLGGSTGLSTSSTRIESNQAFASFGHAVAGAGDVNGDGRSDIVVGAPGFDAGQLDEGAVFVFHGASTGIQSGTTATASARLESDQPGAQFGDAISGAGDFNGDGYADILVGSQRYATSLDQGIEGAAFLFQGSTTGVRAGGPFGAALEIFGYQTGSLTGASVTSAGDVNGDGYGDVVIGVPGLDQLGDNQEGAAWIVLGGEHADPEFNWVIDANQLDAQFGASAASAGDVNADGFDDVIVGAPSYDKGQGDEGAAFLFLGGASGISTVRPPTNAASTLESNQAGARFGASVDGAGDVNGDGYGDVIVGAPNYSSGSGPGEGAAFVFHGSSTGLVAAGSPTHASARIAGDQSLARFGALVARAGDLNGDGNGDVLVGSPDFDGGETDEGAIFAFHGSAGGLGNRRPDSADAKVEGNRIDAHLGSRVAAAGDLDSDGYSDIVIGDPGRPSPFPFPVYRNVGAALTYHGGPNGLEDSAPAATLFAGVFDQTFGVSVDGAGDVNGDGYSDLIVGSVETTLGTDPRSAAYLYHGGPFGVGSGDSSSSAETALRSDSELSFDAPVAAAGDLNGDSYADVLVGAASGVYGFFGSANGIASGSYSDAPYQLTSSFGQISEFASGGDVNGDGFADFVVGDTAGVLGGTAYLYLGNGNYPSGPRGARASRPRQLRAGASSTNIAPLGGADSFDSFQVRLRASHPSGRGRVKLEVEVCPTDVAFLGAGCTRRISPTWTDSTATAGGVDLTETVPGLVANTVYRWRARVLHAPLSVTAVGIVPSAHPPHGAWRRLSGGRIAADVRTTVFDMDHDGIPDATDPDIDGDGLANSVETRTGIFLSPSNTGTSPVDPDSDGDGFFDGWEISISGNPNDPDSPGFSFQVFNQASQSTDQPKYRWRTDPSTFSPYLPETVAPANLPVASGYCSMRFVSTTEITVSYGFVQPPTPPTSGSACCSWRAECELTCFKNLCPAGVVCPAKGPGSECQGDAVCINEDLDCAVDQSSQAACDDEQTRLLGLGVPACCFLSAGASSFRWNTSGLLASVDSDGDGFPDPCDTCPAIPNKVQLDYDQDGLGNECDPIPLPEPDPRVPIAVGLMALSALRRAMNFGRSRSAKQIPS